MRGKGGRFQKGCKGGPGYRGPNNKCVGYANINQMCGPPPHAGCLRECAIVREGSGPDSA